MEDIAGAGEIAREAGERTRQLLAILRQLDAAAFASPSDLPGWSRLTVVCHLRYGTQAMLRMTIDALAGRATSYYPAGRDRQRPHTLQPEPGECTADMLDVWEAAADGLDDLWPRLDVTQWRTDVIEPEGNPDLGTIPVARFALARLTEVDVHGTDLDVGARDWSPVLVAVALPTRLGWLATRRANHRVFDRSITGSWLIEASDGPRWLVAVDGNHVESRPAIKTDDGRGSIRGTSRDLLALLLGRPRREPLCFAGDVAFARSFSRAFPGP